jgi:hypothetical protein
VTDRFAHLERARDEVLAEAESFRLELEPILAASLRAGMERLTSTHAAHLASLDDTSRRAMRETCERASPPRSGRVGPPA